MLLPEINIPVSIEIFQLHVERFIRGYVTSDQLSFGYEKKDFLNGGYRYSIFCYQEEPNNSSSKKIGEIDILIVHPQKVHINASLLNIEKIKEGIDFFNDFYFIVFDKWEVTPFSDDFWNGKGVVERTIFNIASSNDIIKMFLLNGNLDVFPSYGNYKIMKFAFSMISDDTYSLSHPEYKEIIHQYQIEISKGLTKFHQDELSTKKPKRGVHPRTSERAERIKEIKDDRPYLSQAITVSEYNEMYEGDDFISVYDLRNAYTAMGWKWQRADRSM